jgi:hypothetical protein
VGGQQAPSSAAGARDFFSRWRVVDAALYFDTTEVARQLLAAPKAGGALERMVARGQRARVRSRHLAGR